MLAIPNIAGPLVRTARQRLAAFIASIPVRVKDGTELLLRPVLPGDTERFGEGSSAFSPESVYQRFLSGRAPTEGHRGGSRWSLGAGGAGCIASG